MPNSAGRGYQQEPIIRQRGIFSVKVVAKPYHRGSGMQHVLMIGRSPSPGNPARGHQHDDNQRDYDT
jgi:hypothetical protein